ncbi:MAG: mechanosensitive ion channel domain-containing protein [Pseudomonadota bacterium]
MRLLQSLVSVWFVCLLIGTPSAHAQGLVQLDTGSTSEQPVDLSEPLTATEAEALVSRLSDSQVRDILLDQLGTKAEDAAQANDSGALAELFYHATTGALTSIITPIERLQALFSGQARAFSNFFADFGGNGIIQFILYMVVIFGAAYAIELIFRRFTRKWNKIPQIDTQDQTLRQTLTTLFQRLCVDVVAVGIFILAAALLSRAFMPEKYLVYSSLIGPWMIALPRFIWATTRFTMAPHNPAYRLVNASDDVARASLLHSVILAFIVGFSQVIVQFNVLNGVPMGETRIGFWLNLIVHIYVAWVIWRYRDAWSGMMRGKEAVTKGEEWVARVFPYFCIFVAIGTWWIVNMLVSYQAFELLGSAPHYKTMMLLLFAPLMDTAIRGLVRHLVPPMQGEGAVAERAYLATKRSYIRIGRIIVFGIVLIEVAGFWGMTATSIASAGVGERVAARLIEFLMILSVGYLIYEVVSLYINRKLAAEMTASGYDPENEEMGGGDGGGAGGSRLSTVLPLILAVARVAIVILFLLLGLSNIGVDTTPLLAGAGIVGLAIGFGAQKLVTDVVSGIFFLVDDAFRTGEYVEVEGTVGTVEKISIRSMQLRHHKGPVHTIPYGEIPKITNYSRDWVIMKLRFTVPFDTDPNKVKKIFKKIGADMLEHEVLGEDFLQPFKSQGVLEIDDVGMVIRGKFMAKPGKQFMIRKEIFNRVSAAFGENDIDFARREVRVAIPGLDDKSELDEEDKAAIAAAASQAADAAHADDGQKSDAR